MGKILMLAIIIAIIYFLILPRWRIKDKKDNQKKIDSFVECEKCGTYIDIKDTIISNGKYICKECIKEK